MPYTFRFRFRCFLVSLIYRSTFYAFNFGKSNRGKTGNTYKGHTYNVESNGKHIRLKVIEVSKP